MQASSRRYKPSWRRIRRPCWRGESSLGTKALCILAISSAHWLEEPWRVYGTMRKCSCQRLVWSLSTWSCSSSMSFTRWNTETNSYNNKVLEVLAMLALLQVLDRSEHNFEPITDGLKVWSWERDRSRLRLRFRAPASTNRPPVFGKIRILEAICVPLCIILIYTGGYTH